MCESVAVVRQLCDPSSLIKGGNGSASFLNEQMPPPLQVKSIYKMLSLVSQAESQRLISPSFSSILEGTLPLVDVSGGSSAAFGGAWFWEGYRHALLGEDVVFHLGGSGVNLAEDTIESQMLLRRRAIANARDSSSPTVLPPAMTATIRHGSAKLEIMHAIALSVVLHVVRQPILEREQGPQALVLCATKDQCDEFSFILGQYCAELHLVVHNLFELFPSMPAGRRAEVVVATPMLWERVAYRDSSVTQTTKDTLDLEQILSEVHRFAEGLDSGFEVAFSSTRALTLWRPYKLCHVAQLVLFDLDLQVAAGFAPLIVNFLTSPALPSTQQQQSPDALPRGCQLYAVCGGASVIDLRRDQEVANLHSAQRYVRIISERTPILSGYCSGNGGMAEIHVAAISESKDSSSASCAIKESETLCTVNAGVKRPRDGDDDDEAIKTGGRIESKGVASCVSSTSCEMGLLLRHALSHSRLCLDGTAYDDVCTGVAKEAASFWRSFGDPGKCGTEEVQHYVQFYLAFVCVEETDASDNALVAVQETCVAVQPTKQGMEGFSSRLTLLFRHLEEKFNGALFDDNVIVCANFENALESHFFTHVSRMKRVVLRTFFEDGGGFRRGQTSSPLFFLAARRDGAGDQRILAGFLEALEGMHIARDKAALAVLECKEAEQKSEEADAMQRNHLPRTAVLVDVYPSHTFTVMVLRGITDTLRALCEGDILSSSTDTTSTAATSPSATAAVAERKPLGLFIVEECCQYGRVLSYYCYEQEKEEACVATGVIESSKDALPAMVVEGESAAARNTTMVSMFVEFESVVAAAEAVRLFSIRFQQQQRQHQQELDAVVSVSPRAALFRNELYYSGVEQEERKRMRATSQGDVDLHSDDDDDFFDLCLLAE